MNSSNTYKVKDESYKFSLMIIETYTFLKNNNEYILSKQFLRAGTSIGANIIESQDAESKKDFIHKMSIALKEAKETQYRISLLIDTKYLSTYPQIQNLLDKCNELVAVITKIIKSSKANW